MGRPGMGGGGRSFGGSRSMGSHGGTRHMSSGGSSRPGTSRSTSSRPSSGLGGGSYRPPHPSYVPRHTTTVVNRSYHYGPSVGVQRTVTADSRAGRGMIAAFLTMFVVLFMVILFIIFAAMSIGKPQSTIQREKLNSGNAFVQNCIYDDLGWFENQSKVIRAMSSFKQETGIQPWVVLTRDNFSSDSQRESWVKDYYDTHCDSDTFLIAYFDLGSDYEVGSFVNWQGNMADSVMDNEAVDIFYNYLFSNWENSSYSLDEVFIRTYDSTADTIMKVSTTGKDLMKWMIIAFIVVVSFVGFVVIFNKKRAAERERAEETERILQAGQNQATFGTSGDDLSDLTDRYDNM